MADAILTAERLRELLHYDPDTGIFTWRISRRGKARAGSVAGAASGQGYLTIRVDGVQYQAHRLAWLYVTGALPKNLIDHRDTVKLNNRFKNLRDTTPSVNNQNLHRSKAQTGRESRLLGARPSIAKGKWVANITVEKVRMYLGIFDTQEAAHAAYMDAKRKLHPGFVEPVVKKADLVSDWEKFI